MRHIGDDERLARLATRHAIAPWARVADPVAATRAVVALHSTEPATVYLSLAARVDGLTVADVDRALFDERTLVKQLAMRRTLFTFPRDLLPAVWASASTRVADQAATRLAKELEQSGVTKDGKGWILASSASVLELLSAEQGWPDHDADPGGAAGAVGHRLDLSGHQVGRRHPDRAAAADPARCPRRDHPRPQRRALAAVPPRLDDHLALAG